MGDDADAGVGCGVGGEDYGGGVGGGVVDTDYLEVGEGLCQHGVEAARQEPLGRCRPGLERIWREYWWAGFCIGNDLFRIAE